MILFNRKKDNEEEDLPSLKATEGQVKKKPRKKKKEPPKPWGKKERYLVVFVLLITTMASALLAASAREWKLPGIPRIKLPSINLEKTVVIEKEGSSVVTKDEISTDQIVGDIDELTRNLSGVYGMYVVELLDDQTYGLMQDDTFQAASLIKLPVMTALLHEAERGSINLDAKYVLRDEDKIGGSGSLQYKDAGYEITYREMLELMGQQSDNTAFNIVRNRLGVKKINSELERIGMIHTSVEENTTTPRDVGIFFQKLWRGKLTDSEGKNMLFDNLTDTAYEEWITPGIPDDIQVVHKFGREVHVVNDAGIIRSKNPFVLVVMSKGVVEKEADEIIPEIARSVYGFESERDN